MTKPVILNGQLHTEFCGCTVCHNNRLNGNKDEEEIQQIGPFIFTR